MNHVNGIFGLLTFNIFRSYKKKEKKGIMGYRYEYFFFFCKEKWIRINSLCAAGWLTYLYVSAGYIQPTSNLDFLNLVELYKLQFMK